MPNPARVAYVGMAAQSLEPRIVSITINVPMDTENKIDSFATLAEGWDYGHGGPIARPTLETAVEWNAILRSLGFFETNAFPGGDGEVAVTAGYGAHHLEIIIEPDRKISIAYDQEGKQKLYLPSLSAPEAKWAVSRIAGEIWSASDYYTRISMTRVQESSQGLLSETLRQMGRYRSLGSIASSNWEPPSAPTSDNTMSDFAGLWEIRPSSGGLNPAFFRRATR
jgi:hypothetical protein